jgi:hypothetical protein
LSPCTQQIHVRPVVILYALFEGQDVWFEGDEL